MVPDDSGRAGGWQARLALGFERRGERTVLAHRSQQGPLAVQKALYPEGESVCHAIVLHPPAGIAGGDQLSIDVTAHAGAHALLTTPGAGKWYRSAGPEASQRVRIDAAAGARIEWLPQETIVYDGARAAISWHAELAADARLAAWDIVCLGRTGSGEGFAAGRCRIDARLARAGRVVWRERGEIAPGSGLAGSPAGLAGQPVFGTFIAAAPEIPDDWLARARSCAPPEGGASVTRMPGVLLARYLGPSTEAARGYFTEVWQTLRSALMGCEPSVPRIWRT
jgi:urease accessory protein